MQPAKDRASRSIETAFALLDDARMAVALYEATGRCRFLSAEMVLVMGDEIAPSRPLWDVMSWKAAGVVRDVASTLADGKPRCREFVLPTREQAIVTVHRLHGDHAVVSVLRGVGGSWASDGLRELAEATSHRVAGGLVQARCALEMLIEELRDSPSRVMLAKEALESVRRVANGVADVTGGSGAREP
jgi:hypothetical protein